jgi:hypothetical protein
MKRESKFVEGMVTFLIGVGIVLLVAGVITVVSSIIK